MVSCTLQKENKIFAGNTAKTPDNHFGSLAVLTGR